MKICAVSGCEEFGDRKGHCNKHYHRLCRHDDPLGGGTGMGEARSFFLENVGRVTDDCILWPYGLNVKGYGQINIGPRNTRVHVLACEQFHGPRPPGLEVAHSCHVRTCFNPRHLRWATHADNMAERRR